MTHWEILDDQRILLLRSLQGDLSLPKGFYMAGGTALSLQLGLRKSNDFDFFIKEPCDFFSLSEEIQNAYREKAKVDYLDSSTWNGTIDGVKVSFFQYKRPLLESFVMSSPSPIIPMASLIDIACMKIIAIAQWGAKKDFYDLFWIIQELSLSPEAILNALDRKFGKGKWPCAAIIHSLIFFEDAEPEPLPFCFKEASWEAIKEFFHRFDQRLIEAANRLQYP